MAASEITVIIPAKDASATIRRALVSTLRELPRGSRVVVRSDGSTDNTADVVRSLRDRRVRVIEDSTSIGVAASLNQLLEHVETPLVARMDADDVVLPGRWGAQLRSLAAGHDIVFTPVVNWFAGTPMLKPQWPETVTAELAPLLLLVDNPFMHPTMLATTSALRKLEGFRAVPSEDYELWLRAAAAGLRVTRLAAPRLLYRRHPGQITAQSAWRLKRAKTTVVEGSFLALAEGLLGFRPTWFGWRRDGLPADAVPRGVRAELAALEDLSRGMTAAQRRPLLRRTAVMRRAADAAARPSRR